MELDQKLQSKHIYDAFAHMQAHEYDRAEVTLREGIAVAQESEDTLLLGLCHSSLGVLYKLKKDFRQAWRYYDQAEKLLPDNAVLKLISARLLIEVFSQYDIALGKLEKIPALAPNDPLMTHQVDATSGFAYAKKGNREKVRIYLEKLVTHGFDDIVSAGNIDFKLVEVCVRKGWHKSLCDVYLEKALAFARSTREDPYARVFERLLSAAQREAAQGA